MKRYARLALLTLLLLLGLTLTGHSRAQTHTPQVEVRLAWQGITRYPGWTEVQITLTNEAQDWQGELQINDAETVTRYRLPLTLPAQSQKTYRLPLYLSNRSRPQLRLVDTAGAPVFEHPLAQLRQSAQQRRVCVQLSATPLETVDSCQQLALLSSTAELPETAMAWDTISVLILNGVDTSTLTPAQQEALLAWVGGGGQLLLGGGQTLAMTLTGLPDALRIATPGSPAVLSNGLPISPPRATEVVAVALELRPQATVHLRDGATILAATAQVGLGTVDVIGWDLGQPGSLSWASSRWENAPIPAIGHLELADSPSNAAIPYPRAALQLPQELAPNLWSGLIILPLYILLMGPLTLFIVRRLRRPVLAWVLWPAWILLMVAILAIFLSGAFAQTFPLAHELGVLIVPGEGLPARAVQVTAIFAPRTTHPTWSASGAPRPIIENQDYYYGAPATTPQLTEITWREGGDDEMTRVRALGPFMWGTEGIVTAPEITFALRTPLTEGASHIQAEISSAVPLSAAKLLLEDGAYWIPLADSISANTPVTLDLDMQLRSNRSLSYYNQEPICAPLSDMSYYYWGPTRPTAPRIKRGACYLVGVIQQAPFPTHGLNGLTAAETCLYQVVPCPTQGLRTLTLSDAFISDFENGWNDEFGTIYINAPQTRLTYQLPGFISYDTLDTINIVVTAQSDIYFLPSVTAPPPYVNLELWNWENLEWLPAQLQVDASGTGRLQLTGEAAQQLVNVEGELRLRLAPTDPQNMPSLPVNLTITLTAP